MFFTKYTLDINNSSIRASLKNEYDMHRNVQSLFNAERKDSHVLYNRMAETLYIYSDIKPLFSHEGFTQGISKEINFNFKEGDTFRFNMKVFPAKKVAQEGCKNSKRVPIRGNANKVDWIMTMANKHGFNIVNCELTNENAITLNKNDRNTTIIPCTFNGELKITDPTLFNEVYTKGLGSEKAFGMGMILLAPAY